MWRLIALLLVAGIALLGCGSTPGPAQAKFPGRNGQILFLRSDPATQEGGFIYTVNPDGSHARKVLPFALDCPHWSPNGSLIAACGRPDGSSAMILDPDTGSVREIFSSEPTLFLACPVWSPDSKRLTCGQFQPPADPSLDGMYSIRSSDGGDVRRITSNPGGQDEPADYSPDGTQVVFIRTDPTHPSSANQAIFVTNLDGTGLRQISPWGSRGLGINTGWSPDGKTIVFSSNGSLYRVHPDGTGLATIPLAGTNSSAIAFDPGWSPDGTKIVFGLFTSPGSGQEGIYTANVDGSDLQQVTDSPTHDDSQDWGEHPPTG
jgi:Tol biopolymer transport system component